ncbi:disA bacterial checkpoint controller nucleotide-binding domain-containing protein [Ditylenchus destructor]|nr:disA bacterial checkpoint controller nucleotide-binding domain-containing protein [Ditylenchus destructor]
MERISSLVQGQNKIAPHGYFSVDFTETVFFLAQQKIGATVIINPQINPDSDSLLHGRASGGTLLNEPYSSDKLDDIFRDKNSPMSDGAVVVNLFPERTIYSAGNKLLPDSLENWEEVATESAKHVNRWIEKDIIGSESLFSDRCWSAYSASRHIDALIVVVCEEEGRVELFENGNVDIGVSENRLIEKLTSAYYKEADKQSSANDSSNGSH